MTRFVSDILSSAILLPFAFGADPPLVMANVAKLGETFLASI